MNDKKLELSPAGRQRRDEILSLAKRTTAKRIQMRRIVRTGLAASAACLVIAIVAIGFRGDNATINQIATEDEHESTDFVNSDIENASPPIVALNIEDDIPKSKYQFIDFEVIQPDDGILDRYVVNSDSSELRFLTFEILDDDQLIAEIIEHDLPYGLAKIGEEVMLLPHEVEGIH